MKRRLTCGISLVHPQKKLKTDGACYNDARDVLVPFLRRDEKKLYNPPNRKMLNTAIFERVDIWSFKMLRTGRVKMAISATILGTAFPMKKFSELMHTGKGCIVGFQKPSIGLHESMATRRVAIPHLITNAPTI